MYDRNVAGEILDFEASGALYHSALVMQDDQTETFWALMTSSGIGGPKQGVELTELPISEKATWADWSARYPDTLLLQHNGKVHIDSNPYDSYFNSDRTFRPVKNPDNRLPQKASVFTFDLENKPFAITHQLAEGGWRGKAGKTPVLIWRGKGDSFYRSTFAWVLRHNGKNVKLKRKKDRWQASKLGVFDPAKGRFENGAQLNPVVGMDTFWYIWTQYHPKTRLLGWRPPPADLGTDRKTPGSEIDRRQ